MASPHLAGLLSYFLSLQPSEESEYGMAAITPAKLKKNMISIATENALSDIPSDTPNLLAFNGGGKSNYSEIISEGGYTVERTPDNMVTLEELEKAIEGDFNVVSGKVVKGFSSVSSKAEELSQKIHEVIDEELKEFFEEIRA